MQEKLRMRHASNIHDSKQDLSLVSPIGLQQISRLQNSVSYFGALSDDKLSQQIQQLLQENSKLNLLVLSLEQQLEERNSQLAKRQQFFQDQIQRKSRQRHRQREVLNQLSAQNEKLLKQLKCGQERGRVVQEELQQLREVLSQKQLESKRLSKKLLVFELKTCQSSNTPSRTDISQTVQEQASASQELLSYSNDTSVLRESNKQNLDYKYSEQKSKSTLNKDNQLLRLQLAKIEQIVRSNEIQLSKKSEEIKQASMQIQKLNGQIVEKEQMGLNLLSELQKVSDQLRQEKSNLTQLMQVYEAARQEIRVQNETIRLLQMGI